MGHTSLTAASASTISQFSSEQPSTLLLPSGFFLLPSAKHDGSSNPPSRPCPRIGAEQRGRGERRRDGGREEGPLQVDGGYHGD